MRLMPAQIDQAAIIWILVADGNSARIYRYHRNKQVIAMRDSARRPHDEATKQQDLTLVPGMEFHAESLDDFQGEYDGGGLFIGGAAGRNRSAPRLDIHDEVRQNLVVDIAARVNKACGEKDFDHLVIAAPAKILGALRLRLHMDTLGRVIGNISKDFTHDRHQALLAHLRDTLEEARVA